MTLVSTSRSHQDEHPTLYFKKKKNTKNATLPLFKNKQMHDGQTHKVACNRKEGGKEKEEERKEGW